MKPNQTIRKYTGALLFSALLTGESTAMIQETKVSTPEIKPLDHQTIGSKGGWAFAFDNDVLVPGSRDQDYTYGINLTFSGNRALDHWLSLHRPLEWLDSNTGISEHPSTLSAHKIEYGLFGFTPEDITLTQPADGDRPYASLLYVSSTSEHYIPQDEVAWNSTLTVGALGLNLVGELQKTVHDFTDGDQPRGWDTQISAGGEPTARYSIARQQLITRSGNHAELKNTVQASLGYLTEVSWSLSGRLGKLHTPWLSFNPELTSYGEKSAPNASAQLHEHYWWGGVSIKARAYNAFLQGQFRNSELSYGSDDLNHGIAEAWLGYSLALTNGYRFTYSLRGHTSEVREGPADRDVLWGGIQVARVFD